MSDLNGQVRRSDDAAPRKTIYDIAGLSGVSPATVSRYLNNSSAVSAPLRQRIAQAITQLDFRPNPMARALANRRTGIVALAVPSIDNPRWPEVARGLETRLTEAGYNLVLINLGDGRERELRGLEQVSRIRAEALAVAMLTYQEGDFARLQREGVQIAILSNDIESDMLDAILPDRVAGVRLAVEHLALLGHRRIALVDRPDSLPGARARIDAFTAAGQVMGLDGDALHCVPIQHGTIAEGQAAASRVIAQGVTAAIASSDLVAVGLWIGLEDANVRVPRDISLVGMDDIPAAALMRTGLTTLALDRVERGRLAAELLLVRLAGHGPASRRRLAIPPRLVVRSTTAPPPA